MRQSFDNAFELLMKAEGYVSNDPRDAGGLTKYGISQRAYPNLDILSITKERAKEIYLKDYWIPSKCDDLPYPIDRVVFDTAVNMGVFKSATILQTALGVVADGSVGPKTMDAVLKADDGLITRYLLARLFDYSGQNGYPIYKNGWFNRLLDLSKEIKS